MLGLGLIIDAYDVLRNLSVIFMWLTMILSEPQGAVVTTARQLLCTEI